MTPERRAILDAAGAVEIDPADLFGLDETDRIVLDLIQILGNAIRWIKVEYGLSDRRVFERMRDLDLGRVEHGDETPYDPILRAFLELGGKPSGYGGWTPADDYRRPVRQPRSLPTLRRPPGLVWKKYRG